MCGIAGWAGGTGHDEPSAARRLQAMCDAIAHRGPDDYGAWTSPLAALGMRRLSILDIEGGKQPMATPDGRWRIVFNGEIFNHAALRAELSSEGVAFRTRSDTEVLLHLLARRGIKRGLTALNGMFAAALWDESSRQLTLARDRMGVKPLYYSWDGESLLFGSEIKAILAALPKRPEIAPRAIWDYLTLRYVPAPHTIWRGVMKLPPAHYLTFAPGGAAPEIARWWDMPGGPPPGIGDQEAERTFEALLTDAVDLRMLADVPVGIMLSGGLDSSVVAALAARNGRRLKTFSVAFEGAGQIDERPFARQVARAIGAEHREIVIDARTFQDFIPSFVHYTDEPLADLASIPLHFVSRLAREDVKVVLSGEGADEILGGYTFDYWAARWDSAARMADLRPDGVDPADLDLRRAAEPISMTNYLTSAEKRAMLRRAQDWPDTLDGFRAALARFGKASPLDQALFLYCQDWLVEDLLMKADKMSMAASLELRTPFLDYRLVEFAFRLPDRLRVGADGAATYATKRILRDLGKRILPEGIAERPKMGFPVPAYDWLSGPLRPLAHDLVAGADARVRDWLRPEAVDAALSAGTNPEAGVLDRHKLWHVMILEAWLRKWT